MLQMEIYKERNGSHHIQSIGRNGETFARFDEEKGVIDLTPFNDYVGEEMVVTFYKEEPDGQVALSNQIQTVLQNVGVDPSGYYYIQYDGDEKIE